MNNDILHGIEWLFQIVHSMIMIFPMTWDNAYMAGWWFGTFGLFFPSYWECHHPNWRTPSFFGGVGLNHQPAGNTIGATSRILIVVPECQRLTKKSGFHGENGMSMDWFTGEFTGKAYRNNGKNQSIEIQFLFLRQKWLGSFEHNFNGWYGRPCRESKLHPP